MHSDVLLFLEFREKVSVVREAREMGFKVILVTKKAISAARELFDEILEVDLSVPQEVEELVHILKNRSSIRGIVCNYEPFVLHKAFLAEKLGLKSSSPLAAARSRNKALQRQSLANLAENVPFHMVRTFAQAKEAFERFGSDAYLKSLAGVKSRFVFHVRSEAELQDAWKSFQQAEHDQDLYDDFVSFGFRFSYPDPKKYLLLEKACDGFQVALTSFVGQDEVWHAPSLTDIYPASILGFEDSFLAFRMLPSKLSDAQVERARSIVEKVVQTLGLQYCGLHTELIIDRQGEYKIIEVASRLGGYRPFMYREVYGMHLAQKLLQAVLGRELTLEKLVPAKYVSMMEIFPRSAGILHGIDGLEALKKDPAVSRLMEKKKAGDRVDLAKEGGTPVLTFLLSGATYDEVYDRSLYYQQHLK